MADCERHIITDTKTGKMYQLPVPPSSWELQDQNEVSTVKVLNLGEVINGTKANLKTWSISSVFPYSNYHFISSAYFLDQWEYYKIFKGFKDDGTDLLYTISDTPIYIPCIITGLNIGENDASGDINYTMSFKENKSVQLVDSNGNITTQASGYVPENNNGEYVWTVREGDTIYTICKKAYGDSNKWGELLKKNNIKNPSAIKVGKVLQL